jgi:hypothetical protein
MSNSNSALNAMKHGCCAVEFSLLPTESAADFKVLEHIWLAAYNPSNEAERHLVTELVHADWLLQRTTRTVLDIETKLYTENPNPLDWTEQQQRTLGRFLRYKTASANHVIKCRKAIEDYRKARAAEKAAAEKQKTKQTKDGPIVDWKQHLRNMRQQAIDMGFVPPDDPDGNFS